MKELIMIIGGIVQSIGVIPYIKEIKQGTTKPNKISWLMWTIAPLIATIAAFSGGVRWSIVPVLMATLIPISIFIASFMNKESYWKIEKFDYICGLLSLITLIFWYITKNPIVAISFAIISDIFAATPTVTKSYKYPETETSTFYVFFLMGILISFIGTKTLDFTSHAFSIYLILLQIVILFSLHHKKLIK